MIFDDGVRDLDDPFFKIIFFWDASSNYIRLLDSVVETDCRVRLIVLLNDYNNNITNKFSHIGSVLKNFDLHKMLQLIEMENLVYQFLDLVNLIW